MVTTVYPDGTYSTTSKTKFGTFQFNAWRPDMSTSFYGTPISMWSIGGTISSHSTWRMSPVYSVTSDPVPEGAIFVDGKVFTDDKEANRWRCISKMRDGWQLPTAKQYSSKSIINDSRYFKINNALSRKQKHDSKRRNWT